MRLLVTALILAVHAAVTAEACIDERGAGGAAGSISCQLGCGPTSFTACGRSQRGDTDGQPGRGGAGLSEGDQWRSHGPQSVTYWLSWL